jgi:hypothetical protein
MEIRNERKKELNVHDPQFFANMMQHEYNNSECNKKRA